MLQHHIANYTPMPLQHITLNPEEIHHYSFRATEAKPQLLNYQAQDFLQYDCHLTNQRLILQPRQVADWQDWQTHATLPGLTNVTPVQPQLTPEASAPVFLQIGLVQIKSLKVLKRLGMNAAVQIVMQHPSTGVKETPVLFLNTLSPVVIHAPTSAQPDSHCAEDFVTLGRGLLAVIDDQQDDSTPDPFVDRSRSLSATTDITTLKRFRQAIMTSEMPVVVNFTAPSCQPCEAFAPVMDATMEQYQTQVKVIKINIEKNFKIPEQYGIDCFPAILIFKAGRAVDQIIGAVPQVVLTKILNRHLAH